MIAKIKAFINKNEKLFVFILILLAVSLVALNYNLELSANDELWNFSNILKMINGYTIYKDLNVIITPLFFYVGKILLKLFGANFLIFRIYNIAIYTALYYLIYKIFKQTKIKLKRLIFFFLAIYLFTFGTILAGASYNILAIDLYLLGILLMLKGKNKIAQGIIIFLIFMAKQNVGIYYAIGYFLYELIENKSLIKTIKNTFPAFLIAVISVSIYLLYLGLTNNLYNFINYAFLGINEFGTKNLRYDKNIILYFVIIAIMYSFMIWICHSKKIKVENKEQFKILTYLSLPAFLCTFPLMNEYHRAMAIIPTIVSFVVIIEKSFFEEITDYKIINIIIKIIDIIFVLIILTISTYTIVRYSININKNVSYDIYYGKYIDDETKSNIKNILNFIDENEKEGTNVKILSYRANLYMNILKRNNKNMDLPFYGNLGVEGEEGLLNEVKELKNTKLLIQKEEDNIYQECKMVRKYIIENYEQIGEIEEFYIYKVGY